MRQAHGEFHLGLNIPRCDLPETGGSSRMVSFAIDPRELPVPNGRSLARAGCEMGKRCSLRRDGEEALYLERVEDPTSKINRVTRRCV
jgi:hypothetical protein